MTRITGLVVWNILCKSDAFDLTLSPQNLKMSFGTTFTFSIILSLIGQIVEQVKTIY